MFCTGRRGVGTRTQSASLPKGQGHGAGGSMCVRGGGLWGYLMGDEQEPKGREQLGGFVCPLSQDRKTARGGPHGGVGMSRGQGSSDGGHADKELAIMIEKLLMLRALKN